ncbi:hypothetical protein L602_002200000640 [Cupriavidus gilardii J11]|uniref:Uncharacterized protein n=1 Tax=Cupriavidus gilardii J11 TaxID=936133 RepID=A0A562BM53_9BURK|nr:hypothetical protein [Cupriavidus gilardii]TWG86009.1 hypothetical protein L602_002200000640 [Cupriavidus gilardii J11]
MNAHFDTKLTDQLERDLIEREITAPRLGLAYDVKRAIAAVQALFGRLQADARDAKIAFANG